MNMNGKLVVLSFMSVALIACSDGEAIGRGSENPISELKDLLDSGKIPQPISYFEKINDRQCIDKVINLISSDESISTDQLMNNQLKKAVCVMYNVFTDEEKHAFNESVKCVHSYYEAIMSQADKRNRQYLQFSIDRSKCTSEFDIGASLLRERSKVQK